MASFQRHRMNRCRWTAPQFTPHTHAHKLIPAEKTDQCPEMCSNSCLSDWLSRNPNYTFNKRPSLSRSGLQHKRTTQVYVREVITAFHCFFSPRSIHTQIQGYWHSGTVKSHKCTAEKKEKQNTDAHREHGKVSGHLQERKEELQPFGEEDLCFPWSDWKRSKNILSLNSNLFLQIHVFLFAGLFGFKAMHTLRI